MRRAAFFFLGLALVLLTGCATPISIKYPAYASPPSVSVSSSTLSLWTETPAIDRLIPDSQVFIAGSPAAVKFLGLIGAAIDQQRAANRVSDSVGNFALKFHQPATEALRNVQNKQPGKFRVQDADTPADVQIIPQARIEVRDNEKIRVGWRYTAKFRDAANDRDGIRNYYYISPLSLAPADTGGASVSEQNSRVFADESQKAMEHLSMMLAEDLAGNFASIVFAENPRKISWRPVDRPDLLVPVFPIRETDDHWIVIPSMRDLPARGMLLLVHKSLVKVEENPKSSP